MKSEFKYLIVVYSIIGIIAYGHAYNGTTEVITLSRTGKEPAMAVEKMFFGVLAAVAWPFYWSIVLQDKK